ncbi:FAA hydrolase family protein [Egibacter rhizosphaerae]|uniref:FAA hydrolase family protein n=1 Tax=Egibacter rhizosphaerae TaxID=1670831 RepID=A0A411YCV5_9ACTN|nr:fumarylacetoacetate hydrolase family protein [Egibacter rhizosphaerae]QBI19005.1 FAA hydrolase family protein [Egibacter rhizosphaerae]
MRLVRVARPSGPAFGIVTEPPGKGEHVALLDGHPFDEDLAVTDQLAPIDQVPLLAPIIPSKVLCVGKNYPEHAREMGTEPPSEPLIFLKPATSVIGPGDTIRLPQLSDEVHHEAEVAAVIGRLTRKVSVEEAEGAILGYTCANDVTARDLQRRDGQWTRAKGFDTFCPLGPWITSEVDPGAGITVRARVDGEVRQEGSTADLMFPIPELVAYCSAFTTLLPGDVILTGTPAGVGPITAGQTVDVEVAGVGTLSNPVEADV